MSQEFKFFIPVDLIKNEKINYSEHHKNYVLYESKSLGININDIPACKKERQKKN